MNVYKPSSAIIIVILLCLVLITPAGAMSIQELLAEVPDRWQGTYVNLHGDTISVDAEIMVPKVEKVPILRVRSADITVQDQLPPGTTIDESTGRVINDTDTECVVFGISTSGEMYQGHSYEPGVQAEFSPLTPDEAETFAQALLQPYCKVLGIEFRLTNTVTNTRVYEIRNDTYVPVNAMGTYVYFGEQYLYGIPYIPNEHPFMKGFKLKTLKIPYGGCEINIASEDIYVLAFNAAIEDAVLAEDVPLVSFADVKPNMESLIVDGYIRDIFYIRFEYFLTKDPDDASGTTYILLPVWEINGNIVDKPGHETPVLREEERQCGRYALFNAQTGKYYDPYDTSADRWDGNYITWDEMD